MVGARRLDPREGVEGHAAGAGRRRAARSTLGAPMLFHLFNTLRERVPGRERLPLRLDADRPGDAHVAADHLHRRALVHPPRARAATGRADPRRRPGRARVEEGHADDGRRADHHGAVGGDGAVVRPAQHAGLAGAAGHRRLRRDRVRRRLPEAVEEEQEGPARQDQAAGAVRDRPGRDDLALQQRRAAARVAAAAGAAARELPPHVGDDDRLDDAAVRRVTSRSRCSC